MITAYLSSSEPARALVTAAGDRSDPIILCRVIRCVSNLEQTWSVCCAESREAPHSWHPGCVSALILCRYSPKQPCPEYLGYPACKGLAPLLYQKSQYGMTVLTARLRPALDSSSTLLWLFCVLFMASALIWLIILLGMLVPVERISWILLYVMALASAILRFQLMLLLPHVRLCDILESSWLPCVFVSSVGYCFRNL